MINRVVLTGRLTKEPEMKYSQTGVAVLRYTLAVNRQFSNANGEKESDFISCIAFKKTAETMANHLTKGSLIGIEGRIQTGSYDGQDGKRVYTTDVLTDSFAFLEAKATSQQNATNNQQNLQQNAAAAAGYQQPTQQNAFNQPGNKFTQGPGQQQPFQNQSNQQYQQQQYQQPQYQQPQYGQQQQFNDPFANKGPIEVSEDQLPF